MKIYYERKFSVALNFWEKTFFMKNFP
jgi:hypothetical protein